MLWRLSILAGCTNGAPEDWVYYDDPAAFVEDDLYRRAVLETSLLSFDNAYAEERLRHVGGRWDRLPLHDPASLAVTAEVVAAARAGSPLPFDAAAATRLDVSVPPSTPEAWIALGRRVFFEYPLEAHPELLAVLQAEAGPAEFGFLTQGDALVGLRLFEDDGAVVLGNTCAQCHVGPDGTGALSNRAMDVGRIRIVADTALGDEIDSTAAADLLALGPGRADVLSDDVFNPYAYPDFGGLVDLPYLHHTANWRQQGTATLALRCETLFITASGSRTRIPRVLAWAVAEWIRSLPPPSPLEAEGDPLGEQVFAEAGCDACHVPPLYSSDRLVAVDEVGTDPAAGESDQRGTGYYRIPSLRGVGRTAPYLHHGALPTLEEMFDPERTEPGHLFGLELDDPGRDALIRFLRSL